MLLLYRFVPPAMQANQIANCAPPRFCYAVGSLEPDTLTEIATMAKDKKKKESKKDDKKKDDKKGKKKGKK